MRIQQASIKNFRLLQNVDLNLEKDSTVIVGRNNSGKTSLPEVMRRLLSDQSASFQLEDFSYACHDDFLKSLLRHNAGETDNVIRDLIPAIELRLTIKYEVDEPHLGALSPFILDLDPTCTEAVIFIKYALKDGEIGKFFLDQHVIEDDAASYARFFSILKERIPVHYTIKVWAIDPNDDKNIKQLHPSAIKGLVKPGFINAQRGLDDITSKDTDVLAKTVEKLFATASSSTASNSERELTDALKTAVGDIQSKIDNDFTQQLNKLMPTLTRFGYPGLDGTALHTETLLDVSKLLSNFTKVRYAGLNGVHLPESYNGLGTRNLIFILFQLAGFYRAYCADETACGVHLIFIEEPEAHLHPQMQEVFISQLSSIAQKLVENSNETKSWNVQFIVSTHSPHIANKAGFESIRYFLTKSSAPTKKHVRCTEIKDFRRGLPEIEPKQKAFLHQYLTLTRCDLYFADKAILVEGLSERLMLPAAISTLQETDREIGGLASQYITLMEVGGAYGHKFIELLDFLELPALIITDLDSVQEPGGKACEVHKGKYSSNACLKHWFFKDQPFTLADIRAQKDAAKIKKRVRIAYQISESAAGPCGRTFEDAFILANQTLFTLKAASNNELEIEAAHEALNLKKSEFALNHSIEKKGWKLPNYIIEGIRWLANEGAA